MSDILYINMGQSVQLTQKRVTVGDVAKLECKNAKLLEQLKAHVLLEDSSGGRDRYIVSIMEILEIVDRHFSDVLVQNIGNAECIVAFQAAKKQHNFGEVLKTIVICFLLFFGVGFSIMSFNNDVGVDGMFAQISTLFMGDASSGKTLIEFCYSAGLGLGIIIFYNHFGAKKLSNDPTPIEVEMRKYEMDIQQTLISGYDRKDGNTPAKGGE